MTTVDAFPPIKGQVSPVPASGPYPWWHHARELEKKYPDWIITFDLMRDSFTAFCYKYAHLSWIYGQTPGHLAAIIEYRVSQEPKWTV